MRTFAAVLTVSLLAGAAHAQPAPPPGGPPGLMPAMPSMAETTYAAAIMIADGELAGRDAAAAKARTLGPTMATGAAIRSARNDFNGLIVSGGRSAFTLAHSRIRLSGPGSNDFLGIGAGAMARDAATLVITHSDIETSARVASAVVAAEESTLRIYNSRLVAKGGPLPADYTPRIGPGMLEPPAPLGLKGTARTVLAMSNSRTFIYNSHIEAAGWGALSTDATGGRLYLEANDSTVLVTGEGYGAYADFGAKVVVRRSRIDSGAYQGVIAGAAEIEFDEVSGRAAKNAVMIHSVMAFDPAEQAALAVRKSNLASAGPVFLVKSANAAIDVDASALTSAAGVLLEVRKNDDPNATQTRGANVPGVRMALKRGRYAGAIVDNDPDRATAVSLSDATLSGALTDVELSGDERSRWTATADSRIALARGATLGLIDASPGVRVTVATNDPAIAAGRIAAPSGGTLEIVSN